MKAKVPARVESREKEQEKTDILLRICLIVSVTCIYLRSPELPVVETSAMQYE